MSRPASFSGMSDQALLRVASDCVSAPMGETSLYALDQAVEELMDRGEAQAIADDVILLALSRWRDARAGRRRFA